MKCINELGISPWPWRQEANGYGTLDVLASDNSLVVAYENPINRHDQENRRLIAAAPELYECLHKFVNDVVCSCATKDCDNCKLALCWVKKAKAVLAKAAGEVA